MSISTKKAQELQKKSIAARITRNISVMFKGTKPNRTRPTDAGFDVYSSELVTIPAKGFRLIPTGSQVLAPDGYFYQILPRSSAILKGIGVQTGTIDAGYTGEIKVAAWNFNDHDLVVDKGERLAQLVFLPIIHPTFREVKVFPKTNRGDKGFGSSGS